MFWAFVNVDTQLHLLRAGWGKAQLQQLQLALVNLTAVVSSLMTLGPHASWSHRTLSAPILSILSTTTQTGPNRSAGTRRRSSTACSTFRLETCTLCTAQRQPEIVCLG